VSEISTETGKSVRTLLKVEGSFDRYILSPNGNRLVVQDSRGGITVWNVGKGRKESLPRKPAEPTKRQPQPFRFRPGDGPGPKELVPGPDQPRGEVSMFFSPDSRYLLMVDFFGISIFDNENGRFLPELEGNVGNVSRHVMPSGSFSARNQLLALTGMVVVAGGHERSFLKVWELKTGKLLKGWPHAPQVAWSPAAPVLAVIEANGRGGTRLGLWDFAAEVATKPRP
jgi:WD40 repeat protein